MKKRIDLCFTAGMLALIAIVLAVTLWRPKELKSYYENRTYAPLPTFSLSSFGDGSYTSDLEDYLCDQGAFRTSITTWKAKTDLNLLHRPVVNNVVVTDGEILLGYEDYEVVDEAEIQAQAEDQAQQLQALNELVESYGGTFLYVAIPSHYAYFENHYPFYLNSRSTYTAAETEAFFSALASHGVSYLDMGEVFAAHGSLASFMSSTDHHFSWTGVFLTYQTMLEELNTLSGASLTVLSEEDLTLTTLPNPYLGSRARKLCGAWSGTEQLTYAQLKGELPFYRYDWENDFRSNPTTVSLPANDWESIFYTTYMGGDVSETILQTERPELPNALIYGDSMTNALETVFYASFNETRSLDLRHYQTRSLLDYVTDYQPQFVVCVRDYEQLLNGTGNGNLY